ncbi:unnamed protein product [Phytophthora lilii]|uniref:Unnamed protein product n=1 Tax=Phytophthora lilii TaxID=2077276 RepID=A0A9W6YKU4_9STRA|nr:unnamed protein product [Phytophthora lilii]
MQQLVKSINAEVSCSLRFSTENVLPTGCVDVRFADKPCTDHFSDNQPSCWSLRTGAMTGVTGSSPQAIPQFASINPTTIRFLRKMHFVQALLVLMVTLLASCNGAATPTKNQLTISTTNATATAKAIEKFFIEDAQKNKDTGFLKVIDNTDTEEERAGAGAVTAGEGARAGTGGTVVSTTSGGAQVVVTTYNNDGLWQRFLRWWNRLFHISSTSD